MARTVHLDGDRLRRARKGFGLTQAALAERLGVQQPNIAMIEKGYRLPPMAMLAAVCRELEVHVEEVIVVDEPEAVTP